MARDGEILNSGILQRMADFLNIGGVRRYPRHLNTDQVQPVYILGGTDLAAAPVFSLGKSYPEAYNLGGLSGWSQEITGRAVGIPLYLNANYSLDLVGLEVEVTYDAAGAIADDGTVLSLYLTRYENYGSLNQNIILNLSSWQPVVTGTLVYRFNLSSFIQQSDLINMALQIPNYLHIPKGDGFAIVIGRVAGGMFPANTSIFMQAHALTQTEQLQEPWIGLS